MSSASISKIFGQINVRIKPDCFIVTIAIIKLPIEAFSSFIWHILILNSRPNSKKVEIIRISPILMFMVNESIGGVTMTILSTWLDPSLAVIENKNIVEYLVTVMVNFIEIMIETLTAGIMEIIITTTAAITMSKVWTIHHPTCHHLLLQHFRKELVRTFVSLLSDLLQKFMVEQMVRLVRILIKRSC